MLIIDYRVIYHTWAIIFIASRLEIQNLDHKFFSVLAEVPRVGVTV